MACVHKVEQGEYLSLIARKYGFTDWRIIYNHGQNADFRKKRPNPDVIYPGDEVYIPDKQSREVKVPTARHSKFKLKAANTIHIKLVLKDQESFEALADRDCVIVVGDTEYPCKTDKDGKVEQDVPAGTEKAELKMKRPPLRWTLELGHLDPVQEPGGDAIVTGVQARLNNLGFDCGAVDGILGPRTKRAVKQFQRKMLGRDKPEGNLDADTLDALVQKHES